MKYLTILFAFMIILVSCENKNEAPKAIAKVSTNAKVRFVELGSVNCVPCKQMKIVTEKITAKYKDQLAFEFIDVNKDKDAVDKYKIQLIPTQIFYNSQNKEIFRHTGFYPEEKIDSLLQANGLTIK